MLLGASTLLEKELQKELEPVGLTPAQYYILSTLGRSPDGALAPSKIQAVFPTRPNLSETLDRLVRDGVVERKPNLEDGRSVLICISTVGRRMLERGAAAYTRSLSRVLGPVAGDELDRTSAVLEAVGRAIMGPDSHGAHVVANLFERPPAQLDPPTLPLVHGTTERMR